MGAVTGTGSSGTYTGLYEGMKAIFEEPMSENLVQESEVLDLFSNDASVPVKETNGGRYIEMAHYFASGGGYSAGDEGGYLPTSVAPLIKNSQITLKKNTVLVEMTGEAYRRVKQGEAAFLDWGAQALPKYAETFAHHLDRQAVGTGTGIIARINMATPASTDLAIDSAYGIAGYTGATKLLLRNESLRASPNADGSSPRTGAPTVTKIDHRNSDIDVTALFASAADNDYLFQGDANIYGNGSKEIMGLLGIVDDGGNVAVFQTLTRADYPEVWNCQTADATGSGFDGTLSEELIVKAADDTREYGGGNVNVLVASTSGARSFWKSLKPDRVINDPAGSYEGGKADLMCRVGPDRVLKVRSCRKVPAEIAFGLTTSTLKRWQHGSGFHWDDTTGSIWERSSDSTGRRDAYFAVGIWEGQLGCIAPAKNFLIENLTAA